MPLQICRCGTAILASGQCPHCDRRARCVGSHPLPGLFGRVPEPCPACLQRDSTCPICKRHRGTMESAALCEQLCRTSESRHQL